MIWIKYKYSTAENQYSKTLFDILFNVYNDIIMCKSKILLILFAFIVFQVPIFAQLKNFEIKKKVINNPQLDSLWKCYCLLNIEALKQDYSQGVHSQKTLEEYIKEDSIKFYQWSFRGKTREQYEKDCLEDIKKSKGTLSIEYARASRQIKKGTFPIPKYDSSKARKEYARVVSSEKDDLKREIDNILRDSTNTKNIFKREMEKLRNIPNKEWVYIFDTIQLGGNNPILYPGEYVTNANPDKTYFDDTNYYGLLMDHNGTFYHAKGGTRILSMPAYQYDFWFRRLKGGTKIIIPNYQKIKNLVTDEYVSLNSVTEADLIIAREKKNSIEKIYQYAKVSDDLIFAINGSLSHESDFIDVSGELAKVRPNASLLSDSTLYAIAKDLMMKWRHFKEEGVRDKDGVEQIYRIITKEDYNKMIKLEKDFPQIKAEHQKAVDKGLLDWLSYSSKAYTETYTELMGVDPQVGLSIKELKNYVVLSKIPKETSTYYKIKHILNKNIYEIIVDSKGIITAYNLVTY